MVDDWALWGCAVAVACVPSWFTLIYWRDRAEIREEAEAGH